MPDLGLLRGVITLVTLLTFIGICWWAYRPENRARFEKDGLLAFGDEDLQFLEEDRSMKTALHDDSTESSTEKNTDQNAEEIQA